jgi:hypothetical protein
MKIKIVSDGTPRGTRVVNAETGEKIERVKAVSWKIGLDQVATATIEVVLPPCDVIAETTELGDEWRSFAAPKTA